MHKMNPVSQQKIIILHFTLALDRPGGLRALAEVLLVPAGGDVRLGAADWALETAKVTSLSDEQ